MHYKNIVIGAGFAGLYFVHKFKPENFIILERENRIGGRIYNVDWNGGHISLGGGILRNTDIHTLKLLDEFGLKTSETSNKYYFSDLEGPDPNEQLFYEPNRIIIGYLKKLFNEHRDEIKKLKLTFRQFLYEYLDYNLAETILSNLLYYSYMETDPEVIFKEKIYQLMRIEPFNHRYILPNGYTSLLDKIIESIGKSNIKLNTTVQKIYKLGQVYVLKCENNIIYTCDNLVLATEKNPKISIDIKEVNEVYDMYGSCPYIRSYGYWPDGHNIKNQIRTKALPGKVLKFSDKILMTCYTEGKRACELKLVFKDKTKEDQITVMHDLLVNSKINITRPEDFICVFWDVGTHYPKPNFNFKLCTEKIKNLAKYSNIYMVGEVFSECNGWVNCAFESVDRLYDDLYK